MDKEQKYQHLYMDIANRVSKMSYAVKLKVGAIIEKDGRIISLGWNGTPSGWDNCCEYKQEIPSLTNILPQRDMDNTSLNEYKLVTKPEVLHAERNALDKLARSHESGLGAIMYCTHSPCLECAKSILGSGIKKLIYQTEYRSDEGIKFLIKSGLDVWKLNTINET